jgi:hypothetical protein
MDHPAGIYQQQAILVWFNSQVDAASLAGMLTLVMVKTRGQVISPGV